MSHELWQHTLRRSPWRSQRQAVTLAVLGLAISIMIGALFLAQSTAASTTGRQLEELIVERDRLAFANEQLRAEIAALQSVPRLLARAQELGFQQASADVIEYLVVDGYNPNQEQTAAPIEMEDAPLPEYDESLADWLDRQVDAFKSQFEAFTNREDTP
ncbi:MAG: hypothetical protein D6737_13170 [Chloroflexi bacterium]|nr:MAG: hypothetical protein D6737_13170 [Chloroflexota bacterium]